MSNENRKQPPFDPFTSPHIISALYFTDQAQYIFREKKLSGSIHIKTLAEPVVSAAFARKGMDTGWMPRGIIRMGSDTLGTWYAWLKSPNYETITVEGKGDLLIPLPAMVMVCSNKKFYLAALKGDPGGLIDPRTKVYEPPLPNVHPNNGLICWGQNQPPSDEVTRAGQAWKAFVKSPFNRDLAQHKSKQYPLDVNELLQTLDLEKDYPLDDLVERQMTLQEWINRVTGRELK